MLSLIFRELLLLIILVKNSDARTILNKYGKIYDEWDYPMFKQIPREEEKRSTETSFENLPWNTRDSYSSDPVWPDYFF
ncbi:Oidioi.mRNA.OKI2018_I69.chr1.g1297.t1.cds [Oikopleura dioica]|uniref:Oidioi.mRNA.OKI2018_I69.chr1.g1297.t1.cds n=1 Tax=Oikopleura dioica TaxID=34765 RepID=A0ABN7SRR6_OIKDI|nr:Oidioi.mRNA.OKI2018_I69.chr1.g1297.t1.cds [Oikopleura dioica]